MAGNGWIVAIVKMGLKMILLFLAGYGLGACLYINIGR